MESIRQRFADHRTSVKGIPGTDSPLNKVENIEEAGAMVIGSEEIGKHQSKYKPSKISTMDLPDTAGVSPLMV